MLHTITPFLSFFFPTLFLRATSFDCDWECKVQDNLKSYFNLPGLYIYYLTSTFIKFKAMRFRRRRPSAELLSLECTSIPSPPPSTSKERAFICRARESPTLICTGRQQIANRTILRFFVCKHFPFTFHCPRMRRITRQTGHLSLPTSSDL